MSGVSSAGQDPTVYVVVLNWNGSRDTIRCLNALARVDYANLHIILVDNGSTNDSVEQIRHAHPDLLLLENGKNLGFAGGNNPGILYALQQNAAFVWLLNNDTEPEPGALEPLVRKAQSDPQIGAVGSILLDPERGSVLAWGGGRVNRWIGHVRHADSPRDDRWFDYITAASMLVPRTAFEQVGLLDERYFLYWEDTEFGFRLRKNGWKLAVASESRVIHKENGSTAENRAVRTRYSTESAMRFLSEYSPLRRVSTLLFLSMRLAQRLVTGRFREVAIVLEGSRAFWPE
jgi:GT2 family glycosyltransferase